VSVLGKGSAPAVIASLNAKNTVLQAEMAKTVVLKYTPHLTFHLDDSIERGARVFKILDEIQPIAEEDDVEQQD
jgi:ribosome-binding factor A